MFLMSLHQCHRETLQTQTDATELHALKPIRDFTQQYTRREKVFASESIPADSSPVKGPSPPLSITPDLMFLLLYAKVNNLALIIISSILFSMINLIPLFATLPYLCLLSLSLDLMRRQYWYQPKSMLWMRR